MSIRIPQKADTDTQSAFQDVEKALAELSARLDQVTELEQKVKELSIVSDTPRPSFITQGDTVIEGDLRVEGGLAVRGDVDAPHTLDGIVVATPEGIGSSAQRVVEVHGSLAVLSALSAENIRARDLQLYGSLTAPGFSTSGLVYRLTTNVTDVGNVGAGEDDLMTYSLPADTLTTNGQTLRISCWGSFAANANAKTLNMYFGATALGQANPSVQAVRWLSLTYVVRVSATSQQMVTTYHLYDTATGSTASGNAANEATPAETLSGAITIKMTGTATSNNDIVQKGMIVEFMS